MVKTPRTIDIEAFVGGYPRRIQQLIAALRRIIRKSVPGVLEELDPRQELLEPVGGRKAGDESRGSDGGLLPSTGRKGRLKAPVRLPQAFRGPPPRRTGRRDGVSSPPLK